MRPFIYAQQEVSERKFVEYWSQVYVYPQEDLYTSNIIKTPLTEDTLLALFLWKFGVRFRVRDEQCLRAEFFPRIEELRSLSEPYGAERMLTEFRKGGAIFRIFWAHCWNHQVPIFDQHVCRAMSHLQNRHLKELDLYGENKQVQIYLDEYLTFHRPFQEASLALDATQGDIPGRHADRALWAFGKHLKRPSVLLQTNSL